MIQVGVIEPLIRNGFQNGGYCNKGQELLRSYQMRFHYRTYSLIQLLNSGIVFLNRSLCQLISR